jgi:diguanylate cyclase (GGDEF)-like protein
VSSNSPRLLIVDDIADNRTILSRRLVGRGFEVVEADGGRAALELIAQQPFDLVLLDITMPDLDGISVLKTIRQSHSPSTLPVIMVTANAQSTDTVAALTLGANDYVTKPVDFPVALARIEAQVARKRAEEALRLTNQQLEHRVDSRTAELSQLNAKLASEIVERRRSEARMEHMAHHDALTGLPNRVLFQDRLRRALSEAEASGGRVAVLCLDLDRFKEVNDTFGHPAGDKLLRSVAQRLLTAVRAEDTVARLSGDEFAIIQPGPSSPEATAALGQRVLDLFQKPFELDADVLRSGVSIGAALFPHDATTANDLLKAADIALYHAKSEGRGIYHHFAAEMSAALEARRGFEHDLRRALERDEFELHYQPLIDLETRSVLGCEALIRWRHPARGFVSPADFIPIAESNGLIVDIGEWVLRTACAEAARWPAPTKIAVNLSPVQFAKPGLVEVVAGALSAAGLDPIRLELEITESLLLGNSELVLGALRDLKKFGIQISMDDFGTGYSSLSYLRQFPFDKIKVDRSFITSLAASTESAAIVRAIVGLATGLGMTTLAEGVETVEQLDSVAAEGCAQAQGFYFSRPLPATEIRAMLGATRWLPAHAQAAAA